MNHICTLSIDSGNGHARRRYEFHQAGDIIEERETAGGDGVVMLSRYLCIGGADMPAIAKLLNRANGHTFKTDVIYERIANKLAIGCRMHVMGTTPLQQVDSADRVVSIVSDDDSADTLQKAAELFKIGMRKV